MHLTLRGPSRANKLGLPNGLPITYPTRGCMWYFGLADSWDGRDR